MFTVAEISYFHPENLNDSILPKGCAQKPEEHGSQRAMRVMVVDDELLIAETLADILRGEGFQAIALSDGAAAIKWAQTFKIDTLICDVLMPVVDGFEVAGQIRKLRPECRVILFSGHGDVHGMLANAQAAGQEFEFLAKPVDPEAVISMLQNRKSS